MCSTTSAGNSTLNNNNHNNLSCLSSASTQVDTRWLGHVEPDDVVIADIAGQALDIVLHGPESTHKNGIVKTNIDSHIHSHPPMHTPKNRVKPSTH